MRQHGSSQRSPHPIHRQVAPRAAGKSPAPQRLTVLREQLGNAGLARVLRALHESALQRQMGPALDEEEEEATP
jgi:hypothetical protein